MGRIYQFDVCAFLVLSIIILSMFVRKLVRGRTNKMFLALVIITLICTVCDMLTAAPLTTFGHVSVGVRIGASYVYYIVHASLLPTYAIFIGMVSGTWYMYMEGKPKVKLLFSLPYILNIALVLINPVTHWVLRFPKGHYDRGPYKRRK